MKQLKLFPEWQDRLKTADIEREQLKLAITPPIQVESNTGYFRPVVGGGCSNQQGGPPVIQEKTGDYRCVLTGG